MPEHADSAGCCQYLPSLENWMDLNFILTAKWKYQYLVEVYRNISGQNM